MNYKEIKYGATYTVSKVYLEDEVGELSRATRTATVLVEPQDDEDLVMVQYENGVLDYVPSDILSE